MCVDLDLPAGTSDLTGPVDAGDGTSMAVERVVLSDEPLPPYEPLVPGVAVPLDDSAELWGALVTATRDYVEKNRFASVVLGLSGGIDSALVATIACDALGPERVHVVGMPSEWSSDHSVTDAEDLARRQGLTWTVVPIRAHGRGVPRRAAADRAVGREPAGAGARDDAHGAVERARPPGADHRQQERVRDRLLDAVRRQRRRFRAHQGRAEVVVFELARWRNRVAEERGEVPPIPREQRSPSRRRAELAPGQLDSDRLPPYEVLDPLLDAYVEHDQGRAELLAAGFDEQVVDRVVKLVDTAEYKRRQSPPGPKVTGRAFGRDRRLPITSRWREAAAPTAAEPETARPEHPTRGDGS